MKHLIKKSATFCLAVASFLIFCSTAIAQTKVEFRKKIKIEDSQIQNKTKGNITVQYIAPESLKNGANYLILKSGNILYVEYSGHQIKSFTLTNAKGGKLGKFPGKGNNTQFSCAPGFCICYGDSDCNDMFSTNACGPSAQCFGNTCVCAR